MRILDMIPKKNVMPLGIIVMDILTTTIIKMIVTGLKMSGVAGSCYAERNL